MDVFDALDALESQIRESPWIPLANMRAVDREMVEGLLRAARRELERAGQEPSPVRPRDEVLNQAANEGRLLIETARAEARDTLRDDRIQRLRQQRYEEIVNGGRAQANQVIREAYGYSVERVSEIERRLDTLHTQVGEGLEAVQKTIKDAEKARRQRKKESSRKRSRERRRKIVGGITRHE